MEKIQTVFLFYFSYFGKNPVNLSVSGWVRAGGLVADGPGKEPQVCSWFPGASCLVAGVSKPPRHPRKGPDSSASHTLGIC